MSPMKPYPYISQQPNPSTAATKESFFAKIEASISFKPCARPTFRLRRFSKEWIKSFRMRGLSMIYPCLPIVYPLFIYDLSMLVIYDLSMVYLWFIHGLSMQRFHPFRKALFIDGHSPNFTRSATRQIETCRYMFTTTCQTSQNRSKLVARWFFKRLQA